MWSYYLFYTLKSLYIYYKKLFVFKSAPTTKHNKLSYNLNSSFQNKYIDLKEINKIILQVLPILIVAKLLGPIVFIFLFPTGMIIDGMYILIRQMQFQINWFHSSSNIIKVIQIKIKYICLWSVWSHLLKVDLLWFIYELIF